MKKSLTIIGGIIIICLIVFSSFKSCYNEMVAEQEKATTAWSNVQSAYQRRADLIPNLVETVKGYAKHEEGTLTEVINARSKATQVTVNIPQTSLPRNCRNSRRLRVTCHRHSANCLPFRKPIPI